MINEALFNDTIKDVRQRKIWQIHIIDCQLRINRNEIEIYTLQHNIFNACSGLPNIFY